MSRMSSTPTIHSSLRSRFLPLYVAAFLQSCVFWYSSEKFFMSSIGFTSTTIGLMAASYSVIVLLVETPSGILADRWSRRGILIIAGFMLAISSFIEGVSSSVPHYIIGALFWGVYAALYTGMYDPIVYDTLVKDTGNTTDFKRYLGYIKALDGLGLVVGSIAGAALAAHFGLRVPFCASIPLALISSVVLLFFKEPMLHKAEATQPVLAHTRAMFTQALHHSSIFGILLILVLGVTLTEMIFEFTQLWLIAISTPVAYFGISMAVVPSTVGLAGLLARHLQLENRKYVVIFTSIMFISGCLIIASPIAWLLVLAQSCIVIGLLSTGIIYLERLHDRLPSNVRSGASSVVSTLGRMAFIGAAILFGTITEHYSVFNAAWLITIPLFFICIYLYKETRYTRA